MQCETREGAERRAIAASAAGNLAGNRALRKRRASLNPKLVRRWKARFDRDARFQYNIRALPQALRVWAPWRHNDD